MLRFETIEDLYFLALIPLFIILFIWFDRRREKKLLKLGSKNLIEKLTQSVSLKQRWIKRSFILSAFFFIIIAMANPQIGTKLEEVKREGIDILVALDVSYSMMAEDIAPNRLMKSKFEIREFIDRLQGDRIGIIPFAGIAFTQCPLTLDYSTAKLFLDLIDEYTIPEPGTSVGSAIRTAINSFPSKERKYKVLIVITDGEDHESDIIDVSKEARDNGIVIYTIGVGSLEGVPIPIYDENGNRQGFRKDRSNNIVTTKLDAETLRQIASTTGGRFYHVTPESPELDEITTEIASMEKKELGSKEYTSFEDRFQIFLFVAIILLFIEFFISERAKESTVWKGRFN
ncbi:MAG: VWA domain-containing protein [Calditrichaeota bacterium]|nr:VWA domain-containing protein [Calditrichota bacterium]